MRALALFAFAACVQAAPPLPPEGVAFEPLYPLWTDGAQKRRWLWLPPGTAIDTSRPDAWDFPPGTRAWKEFSHGRRIETRVIERLADDTWRYAAYVWNAEGTRARAADERGETIAVESAPGGTYRVPSRADCLACHEGAPVPILGYSAIQLGRTAIAAPSERARAALGYLHGNCGHCHNDSGPLASTELALAQRAAAPRASAARTAATLAHRRDDVVRRLRSANPYVRMPPLGVRVTDAEGVALIESFLQSLPREPSP